MSEWPQTLLATATHDAKRGEDVRARINVLSEISSEWGEALTHWRRMNADKKTLVNAQMAPSANDEYFLYQTVLGAWPEKAENGLGDFSDRIVACMIKSAREAKLHTSWTEPNNAYETAG